MVPAYHACLVPVSAGPKYGKVYLPLEASRVLGSICYNASRAFTRHSVTAIVCYPALASLDAGHLQSRRLIPLQSSPGGAIAHDLARDSSHLTDLNEHLRVYNAPRLQKQLGYAEKRMVVFSGILSSELLPHENGELPEEEASKDGVRC